MKLLFDNFVHEHLFIKKYKNNGRSSVLIAKNKLKVIIKFRIIVNFDETTVWDTANAVAFGTRLE